MYQKGRAWIELNRGHLMDNIRQFRMLLPADCALMPAVRQMLTAMARRLSQAHCRSRGYTASAWLPLRKGLSCARQGFGEKFSCWAIPILASFLIWRIIV